MNITVNPNMSLSMAADRHNALQLEADVRRPRRTARRQRRAARAAIA
jgi:hypothetical protein